MMLAVGAYSGPRAARGAVAQPAKNARHVAAVMRRVRMGIFDCLRFISFWAMTPVLDISQQYFHVAPVLPIRLWDYSLLHEPKSSDR
jgi:hypothetical protein